MYRSVYLSGVGIRATEVQVLRTYVERLSGVNGSLGRPVMFYTRSIHTFTMTLPIDVVVLDSGGRVLSGGTLLAREMVLFAAKRWVVEFPYRIVLPPRGTAMQASTMREPCQAP